MKAIVVGVDRQNGIGADNDLLWRLPADMRRFRELTTGGTVVMGRKTYESIGRPLPGRENIVVTRTPFNAPGIICATSLKQAYELATRDTIYVIGGGEIYAQAMDDMDILYVTYVDADMPHATVFFPEVNCEQWQEVARDHYDADADNPYSFDTVTYEHIDETA